jgi:ABC-type antimicrobial peptide transport system permease subunit
VDAVLVVVARVLVTAFQNLAAAVVVEVVDGVVGIVVGLVWNIRHKVVGTVLVGVVNTPCWLIKG